MSRTSSPIGSLIDQIGTASGMVSAGMNAYSLIGALYILPGWHRPAAR
jgi:hypothetical protein